MNRIDVQFAVLILGSTLVAAMSTVDALNTFMNIVGLVGLMLWAAWVRTSKPETETVK